MIKLDANSIKTISLFESITRARVKDCIIENNLTFIVDEGEIAKAIGKKGVNIKKLEKVFKKKIKILEYSSDVTKFVKNLIYPSDGLEVTMENNVVTITGNDVSTKARVVGRDRSNINYVTSIVKRFFEVEKIVVV